MIQQEFRGMRDQQRFVTGLLAQRIGFNRIRNRANTFLLRLVLKNNDLNKQKNNRF